MSTLPANNLTLPLPKTLFGYNVISRIGEGAASQIYAVSDPKTGQLYALKHVFRKNEKDDRYIQQVMNEFEVSKACRHPVLRKCIDLKTVKKFFGPITEVALIMELIDGAPLDQSPPVPLQRTLDIFIEIAQGLWEMAKAGYVHCDMKPHNVMLSPDGKVRLIDFGQACKTGTVKERVQGTPAFISPEQARCKELTEQTDVYNFGATLYWALTGRRVPTLLTVEKVDRDIVKEQKYPSPTEINPQVPHAVSETVMACLRLKPWERIAGIAKVQLRLEQARAQMDRN
jgi:eukaryotic-like serine/threonine-protein kinase